MKTFPSFPSFGRSQSKPEAGLQKKQEGWKQEAKVAVSFWPRGLGWERDMKWAPPGARPWDPAIAGQTWQMELGSSLSCPLLPVPRPAQLCPAAAPLRQRNWALVCLPTFSSLDCLLRHFKVRTASDPCQVNRSYFPGLHVWIGCVAWYLMTMVSCRQHSFWKLRKDTFHLWRCLMQWI